MDLQRNPLIFGSVKHARNLRGCGSCVGQNIVPRDSYGSTLLVSFWCIQCLYSEGQTILFVQIIQINENLGGWQGIIAFWRLNLPKLGEGWQFCDMIFIIDDLLYIYFYILLCTLMLSRNAMDNANPAVLPSGSKFFVPSESAGAPKKLVYFARPPDSKGSEFPVMVLVEVLPRRLRFKSLSVKSKKNRSLYSVYSFSFKGLQRDLKRLNHVKYQMCLVSTAFSSSCCFPASFTQDCWTSCGSQHIELHSSAPNWARYCKVSGCEL